MGGWYLLVYNYSFNRLKINMIHGILINRPKYSLPSNQIAGFFDRQLLCMESFNVLHFLRSDSHQGRQLLRSCFW